MNLRILVVASIVGVIATNAAAQQPMFRAGVEVVRLDVRVTDDAGRPVKDIQPHEIEVIEDGNPRPIVLFQHIAEPDAPVAEAARRTVASEVSTNRGAPRGHLYVIVFDQSHIAPGNEQRARRAVERFLRTRVRPGDRAALYGLPGPGPSVPFTSDMRRLVEALPRVRGGLERRTAGNLATMAIHEAYDVVRGNALVTTRLASRAIEQVQATDVPAGPAASRRAALMEDLPVLMQLVKEDARTIVARANEDARRLFVMLADLMRELEGIEGRKSIILVSEGFYGDNVARELELTAAAAARAYAVVYALDVGRRLGAADEAEPRGSESVHEPHDRAGTLGGLASETDGRLFVDAGSTLDAAFARIAEQSLDYYVIGFEPASTGEHTEYRRVKVKVKRNGARASARTGYARRAAPNPADRRRAINAALAAPFPQQGVTIEFTTYVMGGTSGAMQKIVMSLAAELPVATDAGERTADVVFVVRSLRDGRVVASGTDTMPLPAEARAGSGAGTGMYRVQFEAPAGEYIMRAVVREPRGAIGSADRRFDVRPLDLRGVTASDLILGGAEGGLPVRPAAHSGETLSGVLELYAREPETLQDVEITVDLAPLGSRSFGTAVRAELLGVKELAGISSRGASIHLPLEGVAPGEYLARARVTARGQPVAELAREVRVLAGSRRAPAATIATAPIVTPAALLQGDIAVRFLRRLEAEGSAAPVRDAARLALRGAWDKVDAVLASRSDLPAADDQALRGLARFARGEFGAAATGLRLAADSDSRNAALVFLLGWAYAGDGRDQLAIGAWRAAVYIDPSLVPAHLALADAYLRLSQRALAVQALRAGLSALPGSPELQDRLTRLERP